MKNRETTLRLILCTLALLFVPVILAGRSAAISTVGTPSPTPPPASSGDAQEIDIEVWVRPDSKIGNTRFTRGELYMSSKQKGYFYALVAPEEYTSEGSTAHVEVRNLYAAPTTLGYGLIFHSNPEPLVQGYAFVIDTIKRRYRVVRHAKNEEFSVIPWTKSTLIKFGNASNTLEAIDKGDTTDLLINQTLVTSVKNTYAFKGGQPGLYSGDATKAAFKRLSVKK